MALYITADFVLLDYVEGDSVTAPDVLESWLGAQGLWGEPERAAVFTLELELTKISTMAKETLYISDTRYRTASDHTPANQLFYPRFGSSDISGSLAEGGGLYRRGARSSGRVRILNIDGRLDAYLDGSYAWEGGTAKIMVGGITWDYEIFKPIIPRGRIDKMQFTEKEIELELGVTLADFNEPLQSNAYKKLGVSIQDSDVAHILDSDNAAIRPVQVQDILDDQLVGRRKPLCYGHVKNMEPVLTSTDWGPGYHTFQVHDGTIWDIVTVYEGGLEMEEGVDWFAATDGFYLVSTPVATITCEVQGEMYQTGGPSSPLVWPFQAGTIAARILESKVGLAYDEIDYTAFNAYSTTFQQTAGYAATGNETRAEALNFLFGPRGWWSPTFEGDKITCGWISEPVGASTDLTLDTRHIQTLDRPKTQAPAWKVSLGYGHNFASVSDLLEGAKPKVRKWIQEDWSWSAGAEVDEADRLPGAEDMRLETPWLEEPTTEETAVLDLYKVRRDIYQAKLSRVPEFLWMGDIPEIVYDRFGMEAGREFYVIGARVNPAAKDFRLVLWG